MSLNKLIAAYNVSGWYFSLGDYERHRDDVCALYKMLLEIEASLLKWFAIISAHYGEDFRANVNFIYEYIRSFLYKKGTVGDKYYIKKSLAIIAADRCSFN